MIAARGYKNLRRMGQGSCPWRQISELVGDQRVEHIGSLRTGLVEERYLRAAALAETSLEWTVGIAAAARDSNIVVHVQANPPVTENAALLDAKKSELSNM